MDKRKLENILNELNIAVDNLGYTYLLTAVELYLNSRTGNLTEIYEEIARRYKTRYSRVERAIRHEIGKNENKIKQFFNVDYDITNRRLLALLAREIKRK